MTKVLIVYEMIPEETKFYGVEVSDEDLAWMKKCHGHYVNFEMPEENEQACDQMSEYLQDTVELKVKPGEPLDLRGYDLLIHTGFGL